MMKEKKIRRHFHNPLYSTANMNQEALQKVLIEMDNQLNKSRAELSMVNLQLDRVHTNLNVIKSTNSRLNALNAPDETIWQGVGKAFIAEKTGNYLDQLSEDEKGYKDTEKNLKIKQDYLQTTLEKTVNSMTKIVGEKK
ncbi:Pfd1 protein [Candida orthopsilosis Co 90-125]|uniref:Pfd1 protein n=1 Tax=Candida orthopsilosis (strain 90-125) TaxID=1136231 RepID=H8X1Q4_CANO9|nr:Pfd1 protein [Candida orthopsilosis Co 90-125]CCG22459.1 Pfd1 protein [Candida orthopsilosis Co 90-125]